MSLARAQAEHRQTERNEPRSAAEQFRAATSDADCLGIDRSGTLTVEGCSVSDLVRRFGSPLYVVSENALRANYRRIRDALASAWPHPVNVLYAIKANNNLAIRAILNEEGAGGDCFGEGELYATFMGGADPQKVVLNGSSKTRGEIRTAVELGVHINIDSLSEIQLVADVAEELGRSVSVNFRLKLVPPELRDMSSDYFGYGGDQVWRKKFGFTLDSAVAAIEAARRHPRLHLLGFDTHFGRFSKDPQIFGHIYRAMAGMITEIHRHTGFWPSVLNLGGGWPRQRDPESRTLAMNDYPIEDYVKAVAETLRETLEGSGEPLPELWLEPGRYIVGNAVTLVATVGTVKREDNHIWVNIDASTNDVMLIDTSGLCYHILAAIDMDRPFAGQVDVVGHTCFPSVMGTDRPMPDLVPGDLVAILDAGMYAETVANQFNGVPRPATVLVNGDRAEIIKQRETVQNVFSQHRIPERLRVAASRRSV